MSSSAAFPFDYMDPLMDFAADDIIAQQPIITADDIITAAQQPIHRSTTAYGDEVDVDSSMSMGGNLPNRPKKRIRTSTPAQDAGPPSADELSTLLESDNPDQVIGALNSLLKWSADHDVNFALGEGGERVTQALVDIVDEIIGWSRGNCEFYDFDIHDPLEMIVSKTWKKQTHILPRSESELMASSSWVDFCSIRLGPSTLNTTFTPSHIPPALTLTDSNDEKSAHKIKILEVIAMILRNLSYVSANLRYLSHNLGILRILTLSLYFRNFVTGKQERGPKAEREELGTGNSANNMCLHAVQTILNLAPILDCSAMSIFLDKMFLNPESTTTPIIASSGRTGGRATNNTSESTDLKTVIGCTGSSYQKSHTFYKYGQTENWAFGGFAVAQKFNQKDEKMSMQNDYVLNPVLRPYQMATIGLVAPLFTDLLGITTSRAVIFSALETLLQLLDSYSNHLLAFKSAPDLCLYHLVRLLYIPRLGPDSLEYVDPVRNVVTRVSALKLLANYDIVVDYELRDRSLEVLTKWASLIECPDIKVRLGTRMTMVTRPATNLDSDNNGNGKDTTMYYGTQSITCIHDKVPNTKLYDSLIPCLTTKVGREQTPQLAAKLLTNLFSHSDNRIGAEYVERSILKVISSAVTSQDSNSQALQVTSILCRHILNQ